MSESWRTFAAIELTSAVREKMQQHIDVLRKSEAASWTRVENIHLTVKFFGQVALSDIPKISAALEKATQQVTPFEISIGGVGVFPKPSHPRVIWIGVNDESRELQKLHRLVEDECGSAGFPKEDRAFKPHLTIARLRKPEGARELAERHLTLPFEPISLAVNELILFRSELSPKGSKYTQISRHQPVRKN
jgi:2'-5' RNA ligase